MNLLGWPRRRGVRGMEFRPFAQDLKERGARGAKFCVLGDDPDSCKNSARIGAD